MVMNVRLDINDRISSYFRGSLQGTTSCRTEVLKRVRSLKGGEMANKILSSNWYVVWLPTNM